MSLIRKLRMLISKAGSQQEISMLFSRGEDYQLFINNYKDGRDNVFDRFYPTDHGSNIIEWFT